MSRRSQVTVHDIARKAGVAQSTVSSALHGTGRVSDRTRRRIQTLARKMGYEPRIAAQLLRRNKTGQLGIIVATETGDPLESPLSRRAISRFVQRCEDQGRGYHIDVYFSGEAEADFRPPMQVAGRLVDGTIVIGDVGDRLRDWLSNAADLPWVSIMEPAPLCVLTAEAHGVIQVVEHLVALGHRRIAFAGGDTRYTVHRERYETFLRSVETYGLERKHDDWVEVIAAVDIVEAARNRLKWVERLLSRRDRPTAIVGAQREAIYVALCHGFKVPADLSVVGWESPSTSVTDFFPSLTSIDANPQNMLDAAWELLEARLQGEEIAEPVQRVEPALFIGQSTAPVESSA